MSDACVRYRCTFFTIKALVTGVDALPEVRDHPRQTVGALVAVILL